MRGTGLLDAQIDAALVHRFHPQLIPQVARIGDAVDHAGHARDIGLAEIHEPEGPGGNVDIHQRGQHIPRARATDRQPDQIHVEPVHLDRAVIGQMLLEPAHVIDRRAQRAPDHEPPFARLGDGEIADQLARVVQHRRQHQPPGARHGVGHQMIQPGLGPRTRHLVFGEIGDLGDADAFAHAAHLGPDMLEIVRAVEAGDVMRLPGRGREPQRRLQPPGVAHHRVVVAQHQIIQRRGFLRPRGGQFLVREADRKPARVVFAHLRVGITQRRPFAEARHIHAEHIRAGVALGHPVCQHKAHTTALRKARHDRAGRPEVGQPLHRADQRVAIGREGKGAVDDLLDPCPFHRREMLEADLQRRGDTVQIGLQQFVSEIPRRVERRPRFAGAFIGAQQDALTLLPGVDLTLEIHHADQFAAHGFVEFDDLGHGVGQQIHVLHRQHRQFQPDHAPDLARPQAARVHDVLAADFAVHRVQRPHAVRILGDVLDRVAQFDLRAQRLRGLGIGDGGARRVQMPLDRIPQRAHEIGLVHQGEHRLGLGRGDQLGLHPQRAATRVDQPQEIHAFLAVGHHHAAGQMQPAGLARDLLQLLIQGHGIGLQLGHIGIAVQRVKPARRVPAGPGCEFRAFDQQHIGPASPGQMIQNRAADNAAPDDHRAIGPRHSRLPVLSSGASWHPFCINTLRRACATRAGVDRCVT